MHFIQEQRAEQGSNFQLHVRTLLLSDKANLGTKIPRITNLARPHFKKKVIFSALKQVQPNGYIKKATISENPLSRTSKK